MSVWSGYTDAHRGENILGECPTCHLPIYQSDPRRMLTLPPEEHSQLYHAECGRQAEGLYYEKAVKGYCDRLRGCGYVVELRIIRPVR